LSGGRLLGSPKTTAVILGHGGNDRAPGMKLTMILRKRPGEIKRLGEIGDLMVPALVVKRVGLGDRRRPMSSLAGPPSARVAYLMAIGAAGGPLLARQEIGLRSLRDLA
jgi:hypothetical protein